MASIRHELDGREHHDESRYGPILHVGPMAQHAAWAGLGGAKERDADGRTAADRADRRLSHADRRALPGRRSHASRRRGYRRLRLQLMAGYERGFETDDSITTDVERLNL